MLLANFTIRDRIFLLARRFNCAAHRINKAGLRLICDGDAYYPDITGLYYSKTLKIWSIKKDVPINPLAYLLDNKRCILSAHYQIEQEYILEGHILPFMQGFINKPTYKDVWSAPIQNKPNQSLCFNMGRAFLDKFGGVILPYTLPNDAKQFFQGLP